MLLSNFVVFIWFCFAVAQPQPSQSTAPYWPSHSTTPSRLTAPSLPTAPSESNRPDDHTAHEPPEDEPPDDDFELLKTTFPHTYAHRGCTDQQKRNLEVAANDAWLLAKAQTVPVEGYDYNLPHSQWLGDDWNKQGDETLDKQSSYIAGNFQNMARLVSGNLEKDQKLRFWCFPRWKNDDTCDKAKVYAKSWFWYPEDEDLAIKIHHTVFCDRFFWQPGLQSTVDRLKTKPMRDQLIIDNAVGVSAVTMLHEIYHYRDMIVYPSTTDYAYGALKCHELATKAGGGTELAYRNAESYAIDALAIYLQQTLQLGFPPISRKYMNEEIDPAGA
ncbi:Metalloproteases (zincins), catalytic [Glarea lozoyensis ATCC 20868]|uniref:Metalloproteases (Zincins), catalytic n=1 Tax=Glarea lozoyensis (strain ATCC 20868 / MF5171) TaxID=1116229 RepID=S3CR20_GLAL2|nr:Metalloproteases (zincins), catalytic [Glarea lozoyensis ATCC 20868]EPE28892.1 Metalloproteases (zincins), catalytic [Glarea lozoyensis ATCC 20868]